MSSNESSGSWLFLVIAAAVLLYTLLHGVLRQMYQTVMWIFLGATVIGVIVTAILDWGLYLIQLRFAHPRSSGSEKTFDFADLQKLGREERFNVMAEWNAQFYLRPLTTFMPRVKYLRFVQILPGAFHEPVVCKTHIEKLADDLEFVAISYAWGDWDEKSMPLTLDGHTGFRITWNAYNALRRMRSLQEERLVWIDQISINQFEYREKEEQVGLMGAIYQRAQLVYIYLGACHSTDPQRNTIDGTEVTKCHEHNLSSLQHGVRPWLSMPTIPSLRWWERAWTVQETVVPPTINILLGPHCFTWKDFCKVASFYGPLPRSAAAAVLEVDKLRTYWQEHRKQDDGLPLSELLDHTATREATRSVDRLFSVLAMKSDAPKGISELTANYKATASFLDHRTTQYIIAQERTLDIYFAKGWSRYDSISWVVQFTQPPARAESPLEACRGFMGDRSPAACTKAKCEPMISGGTLTLGYGREFDQIGSTVPVSDATLANPTLEPSKRVSELAAQFYAAAEQQLEAHSELVRPEIGTSWTASDWNTGQRVRRVRATHKIKAWFSGDHHDRGKGSDPPPEFRQYATHCLCAPGRTFFVTRRGFIGVAYPPNDHDAFSVLPGQSIVVIEGAKMPLVLSSVKQDNGRDLICAAYVSCLMNNELYGKGLARRMYTLSGIAR